MPNVFWGGQDSCTAAASLRLKGMTCLTSLPPSFFSIMLLLCAKRRLHCPSSCSSPVSSQLIAHFPSAFNHLIMCQACTSYCLCLGKRNHNDNNNPWKGISTVICSCPFSLFKECHYEVMLFSYVFKKIYFQAFSLLSKYPLLNLIIFNTDEAVKEEGAELTGKLSWWEWAVCSRTSKIKCTWDALQSLNE